MSRVTEINGRYRHFKQKSSSIACKQFKEYITLDSASFTDYSKANRVRKFYTAPTVVVVTNNKLLKVARENISQIKNCQEKCATVKDNTFMSPVTWSSRKQYESIEPNLSTSDKQIQTGHANLNELHD